MSLWGLFVAVGAIGIILSLGAAVLRPRDRDLPSADKDPDASLASRGSQDNSVAGLRSRVEALEAEVDDLHRAVTQLREDNEYLMQRLGDGPATGEFS